MKSFVWDDHFVTGIAEVDSQHVQLVHLVNRLGNLLAAPDSPGLPQIEPILAELSEYAHIHFSTEEGLMRRANVDARHLRLQQQEHGRFIEQVSELAHGARDAQAFGILLDFLIHWLAYHILGADQSMARQIFLIGDGHAPETAYAEDQRLGTRATEPLIAALSALFTQVTERNRDLAELNRSLEARVQERTRELAEANRHLEELSLTDLLTGLPNRRHAMRRLENEWTVQNQPLSLMMIDADGFKRINDSYGHGAGDAVLRTLSQTLADSLRTDDLACRLGGDEFMIICPQTNLDGTLHLARKMLAAVNALRVPAGDGEWSGSVSIGVATRLPHMLTLDELIKNADEGVYIAKRAGRNQVCTAQPPASA